MSKNFLGPFSLFWTVSHLLSRTSEWDFGMNHTVHFRHSNVSNYIHKTLSGSLFFLFFNIFLATCKNSMEKSLNEKCQALRDLEKGL